MNVTVRKYEEKDLPDLIRIWNEVVEDGVAFPQEECLNEETGKAFFSEQTYTAAAVDAESGKVYGLYILHPNNIGVHLEPLSSRENAAIQRKALPCCPLTGFFP